MASSTTTDESANISLRGSSPAETGVFLDDLPIYDAVRFSRLNGIGTFSIFNTAIVNRLYVFPGNPPLEYGNTSAGLISIKTEDNIPNMDMNSISFSLANIGGLTSRKSGNKSAITVFSNFQPSKAFKLINQKSLKDLEDFNTIDLGLHFIYEFNTKTFFKIFNYSNTEGYDYHFRHPTFDGIFSQNKNRNFTVSNFSKYFSSSELTINNGLSLSKANFTFSKTNVDINNRDIYFSVNYHHFFDQLSMKTGFTLDHRKAKIDGKFPRYEYAIDESHPFISFDTIQNLSVPELYTYLKYNLSSSWVLGVGIRKNIPTNDQKNYWSRQLNLNYKLNSKNSINFSTGKYHKYNLASGEITGITLFPSRQVSLDYKFKSDLFELTSAVFHKNTCFDSKEKIIYGVEIFSKFKIFNRLEAMISYTYIHAEIEENNISYPSKYDMNYFVRGSIKYRLGSNFELNTMFIHRQGTYYTPFTGKEFDQELGIYEPYYAEFEKSIRLPDYSKFDLSISKLWPLREDLHLVSFAGINNIFNTTNVRMINYNFDYSESFKELYSKRTIYVGIMLSF